MSFWFSISCCEATPRLEVANHECQISVIRSISGRVRAHHPVEPEEVVVPDTRRPATSGRPLSSVGAGPTSAYGAGRVSEWTACLKPELGERVGLARLRAEPGPPEETLRLLPCRTDRG